MAAYATPIIDPVPSVARTVSAGFLTRDEVMTARRSQICCECRPQRSTSWPDAAGFWPESWGARAVPPTAAGAAASR
jgi:hypothetical protein